MSEHEEINLQSNVIGNEILKKKISEKKGLLDYFSLAVTTFGVGYLPLAPGTWGSMVGVLIYYFVAGFEITAFVDSAAYGRTIGQTAVSIYSFNAVIFLLFCYLGIWAASRAALLFNKKDPSEAVVDEVIGQIIVFFFVPLEVSWKIILTGFILFRLFDIWKPYPINLLEKLPGGLGICADDILAGVFGGICLSVIYAIYLAV